MKKSIYDLNYIAMIEHLKEVRKSKKVTQVALAAKIDWNHRDLSRVENFVIGWMFWSTKVVGVLNMGLEEKINRHLYF